MMIELNFNSFGGPQKNEFERWQITQSQFFNVSSSAPWFHYLLCLVIELVSVVMVAELANFVLQDHRTA